MTRFLRIAAAALIIGGLLFVLAFLGGVHHYRSCFYESPSKPVETSESDFRPAIYPEFTEYSRPRGGTVIPYLFYSSSMPDQAPHIHLRTVASSPAYGYGDKFWVTIETLTVRNEAGQDFALIAPESPRTYRLSPTGWSSYHEDLGEVSGDVLQLTVSGYVVTYTDEKKRFSHAHRWVKRVRTGARLGIFFAE